MTAKTKIAILSGFPAWLYTDALPCFKGHYAVWLAALHEAFGRQEEFDIHWVVLSKDISSPLRFTSNNQHVHVLPRLKRTVGLLSFYLHDRRTVAAELGRIEPDMVHSWGTEDCYGLCGRDFKGLKLHSVQGALKAYMQRARFPLFLRVQALYEPLAWRAFRQMTTESPWAADRVREICPHIQPHIWEYAVEERFFKVDHCMATAPTFLYSGADSPVKNVQTLIRAFSRPELSHVTLKLAGVPQDAYPERTPNIKPLGRVRRDEMARLLSEAWALVHMSLADTGPTIVKEARVVGLPVILSNECGSCQHVEEGKSGFILNPHDEDGLVQAVLAVAKDAQTAQAMGKYGHEQCRRMLSGETMVDNLLTIYRDMLSSNASA